MEADWTLIAVRFALYADLGLLFGLPLFCIYGLRDGRAQLRDAIRPGPLAALLAAAGLAVSTFGFAAMTASMLAVPLAEVDRATFEMLAFETAYGWAFLARQAALLIVLGASIAMAWRPGAALAVIAAGAGVALSTLAWGGHAGATEGGMGYLHLGSDLLHLWAAGLWLGAIAALGILVVRAREVPALRRAQRALAGFSTAGTLAVGTLIVTGVINSLILVGFDNMLRFVSDLYGWLLLLKLLLFGVMLAIAAANRFWLTPAFDGALADSEPGRAARALKASLAVEAAAALAILAIVGWLGTLSPPAAA